MFQALASKVFDICSALRGSKNLSSNDIANHITLINDTLLQADVPFDLAEKICTNLQQDFANQKKHAEVKLEERFTVGLYNTLVNLMHDAPDIDKLFSKPAKILMLGLQGAGKTTSIVKLATWAREHGWLGPIMATSVDFQRPAAIDQLRILCQQNNIIFIEPEFGNAAQTIKQAQQQAAQSLVFFDTPGRLDIDQALMQQLKDINNLVQPTFKFLVIDSMTGQQSISVARNFNQAVDISGAILSKSDSDSKGGVAISFFHELKKPVFFLGTGEKAHDLEKFIAKRIASRLVGQGDIETLAENLSKKMQPQDQDSMQKIMQGDFDLDDFAKQIETIFSLGPIQKLISYMPGVPKISNQQMNQLSREAKIMRAILGSMTLKERKNPSILNTSRKARISKGSGTTPLDIDALLQKFATTKQMMKAMQSGKFGKFF